MYEDVDNEVVKPEPPMWLVGSAIGGAVLALVALVWAFSLQSHLSAADQKMNADNQKTQALTDQLEQTNDRLKAQGITLGESVGLSQKQMEEKSDQLIAAQHAAAASTAKLAKEQEATSKQVASTQADVTAVKTDVGGVKTDVASTQADLAATKSKLTSVIGDAGVMSGLIATNHDELEELKHKGDRNYYEFTLQKGAKPTLLSTVKVELKKLDTKKSKFTLVVSADDKTIEKKDKTLDEPIQFYSGKTPLLFEVVVNAINKNQVVGYLSTPKNAPQPIKAD